MRTFLNHRAVVSGLGCLHASLVGWLALSCRRRPASRKTANPLDAKRPP